MRDLFTACTALVLCLALLAGCTGKTNAISGSEPAGSAAGSSAADSGSAATAMPDSAPTSPDAASGMADSVADSVAGTGTDANAYTAEGLNTVLGGIIGYAADTAGGSLQATGAASELVQFAATAGADSATLGADTQAWLDTLSEEQKQTLRTNWQGVRDMANSIVTDLDNQTGRLADAGVTYDFTRLDMSGVQAFVNTVDSILGAY